MTTDHGPQLEKHEVSIPVKGKNGRKRTYICTMTYDEWLEVQPLWYQLLLIRDVAA